MKRFEDLEVRQTGRKLNKELGGIFYKSSFRNRSFQDQIMRAAQSVTNNIAEGHERKSDKDFLRFLDYAKASSGETRNMLYSALDFSYITQAQFDYFYTQYIHLSVKIHNLIQYIKRRINKS